MVQNTTELSRRPSESAETVRASLLELIDRDLKRHGVDVGDPMPHAPVAPVLPGLIPTTGNVLIPLGRLISRFGTNLRLMKPGL